MLYKFGFKCVKIRWSDRSQMSTNVREWTPSCVNSALCGRIPAERFNGSNPTQEIFDRAFQELSIDVLLYNIATNVDPEIQILTMRSFERQQVAVTKAAWPIRRWQRQRRQCGHQPSHRLRRNHCIRLRRPRIRPQLRPLPSPTPATRRTTPSRSSDRKFSCLKVRADAQ